MRKFLSLNIGLLALGAIVPPTGRWLAHPKLHKAPASVAAPIYNWTGFYIGGAFEDDNGFAGASNDGQFLGGVQIGGE